MEKIGTSKCILNANELGLLWTKGKYPANSLPSLSSVLRALHSVFCCYRTETKENHRPGEGTVPGERLQEDLKNQWRDERDVWASCSSEPWRKKQLCELSWTSLLHPPCLKSAALGIQTWPIFGPRQEEGGSVCWSLPKHSKSIFIPDPLTNEKHVFILIISASCRSGYLTH